MPYIITTYPEPTMAPGFVGSRRAAATLDEAREAAVEIVAEHTEGEDQREAASAALTLSDDGGTVGPLPDGTVIEVRHAPGRDGWRELAAATKRVYATGAEREILDAFNAESVR